MNSYMNLGLPAFACLLTTSWVVMLSITTRGTGKTHNYYDKK